MSDMKNFVRSYDNVYTPDECQGIIDLYKKYAYKAVRFDNSDLYHFDQLQLLKTGHDEIANEFAIRFKQMSNRYFRELNYSDWVPDTNSFEEVRIKKYKTEDSYSLHVDVNDVESSKRYLVGMLYLNDNDGYTTFDKLGIGIEPKAGRFVMFPVSWMFPYRERSPSTEKYVMTSKLNYLTTNREVI